MKLILFLCYFEEHFNVKSISMQYLVDIVNIIGTIYFSNVNPILQKPTFLECWV